MRPNDTDAPQEDYNNEIESDNLMSELMAANDIIVFRRKHRVHFVDITFKSFLNDCMESRNMKRADVIKASGLAEAYCYQIFAGLKNPSRDKLLAIAIAMQLDIMECQKLLRLAGVSQLHPKNSRDSVILFGLKKGLSVPELNDLLYDLEEFTLS